MVISVFLKSISHSYYYLIILNHFLKKVAPPVKNQILSVVFVLKTEVKVQQYIGCPAKMMSFSQSGLQLTDFEGGKRGAVAAAPAA